MLRRCKQPTTHTTNVVRCNQPTSYNTFDKEVGKRENALEEETVKVLEQYRRVKKLERQGKRREERIEKAQQQLQNQANEHFSVIYTTLQLGLKSLPL